MVRLLIFKNRCAHFKFKRITSSYPPPHLSVINLTLLIIVYVCVYVVIFIFVFEGYSVLSIYLCISAAIHRPLVPQRELSKGLLDRDLY